MAAQTRTTPQWPSMEDRPLLRHEILQDLRSKQEYHHRESLYVHSAMHPFQPHMKSPQDLPEFSLQTAIEFCNKTAPIYILRHDSPQYVSYLLVAIHNYIYRHWFRPYRSEIEYGQFLAKLFAPRSLPPVNTTSLGALADLAQDLTSAICTKVEQVQHLAQQLIGHDLDEQEEKLGTGPIGREIDQFILDQEFFVLQPLFRAIAIVVCNSSLDIESPSIPQLSVVIVRTGIEDGLSAPITFDSIADKITKSLDSASGEARAVQTTLETATTFLMELEQREIAAFGMRPDPVTSTKGLESGYLLGRDELLRRARRLGWTDDMGLLEGPSSNWVDETLYPVWSGIAAVYDSGWMDFLEKKYLRHAREYDRSNNKEL